MNALSWARQVAFVDDPTRCNIVKADSKWLLAHRTQKEPITPENMKNLVQIFALREASLSMQHSCGHHLSEIGFAGFYSSVKLRASGIRCPFISGSCRAIHRI